MNAADSARSSGSPALDSWASSETARRTMRANRRRDTKPELAIRSALHQLGMRFRVDFAPLPDRRRRADVVFTRWRVAVYVDGCFWHGCPEHGTTPRANEGYWRDKLRRNRERDAETVADLIDAGWTVVRVWEHESPGDAAHRIIAVVDERRGRAPG